MRSPPPGGGGGGGAGRGNLTFINANRPWLGGDNNRSNVFATWFNKKSNARPDYTVCLMCGPVIIFTRQIPTSRLCPKGKKKGGGGGGGLGHT